MTLQDAAIPKTPTDADVGATLVYEIQFHTPSAKDNAFLKEMNKDSYLPRQYLLLVAMLCR